MEIEGRNPPSLHRGFSAKMEVNTFGVLGTMREALLRPDGTHRGA